MTKIINIFGGPGIGKSTIVAGLFHQMKIRHLDVEIAHEVAKDYVWENRENVLKEDQLIIFAEQHRRIFRLADKVDFVIVDCPLLMCVPYIPKNSYKNLEPLMAEAHYAFDNINFVLNRADVKYNPNGRYHSEDESKAKHREIVDILDTYDPNYIEINVDPDAPKKMVELILAK